jgi:hypothetical protein
MRHAFAMKFQYACPRDEPRKPMSGHRTFYSTASTKQFAPPMDGTYCLSNEEAETFSVSSH